MQLQAVVTDDVGGSDQTQSHFTKGTVKRLITM